MKPERLAEIKARAEKATPGPWGWLCDALAGAKHGQWVDIVDGHPDGDFVCHAREDVSDLVAEVERLRAALSDIAEGSSGESR